MNKLLLLCLLSIMVLYTQCSDCTDATEAPCFGLAVDSAKTTTHICAKTSGGATVCEEVLIPKCTAASTVEKADKTQVKSCDGLKTDDSKKICAKQSNSDCGEVDKPATTTNSGSLLNTFKIACSLIIIFTIL